MNFKLYRQHGALNSPPIFESFAAGLKAAGHQETESATGIPVIWSVLWSGRMAANRNIYYQAIAQGLPVVIIEVGNLHRNKTWRISVDNVNSQGYFGNIDDLDTARPKKLGIHLLPTNQNRKKSILIATQHVRSLQWEGMPDVGNWLHKTIEQIRQHSDRPIVVRPHPRAPLTSIPGNVVIEKPTKIINSYDNYDFDYTHHCVVNHCSGPTILSAINGTPIICDQAGLAYPVSEKWENIDNPCLPERDDWLLKLCHTEWTVDEISSGLPIARISNYLENKISKIG
jgi:hypothetical protein